MLIRNEVQGILLINMCNIQDSDLLFSFFLRQVYDADLDCLGMLEDD